MVKVIEIRSVTYKYPNRQEPALSMVDLEINKGEFVLVTGPSGSGKSTLLRMINGLVPHFSGGEISGEILVQGMPVIEKSPQILSKYVGFVSQNPEAQTILETVEPEIAFALENAAVPRAEMHHRVHEVLDLLGLIPLRARLIRTLSGGERQRVAVASALVLKPEILVLDEPTSQLDPQSAADLLQILYDLNKNLGLTIVLAEHRLERTLPYANRLAYIENGRLICHGSIRPMLFELPQLPPLVELARNLNWDPIPLTIDEAKKYTPDQDLKSLNMTGAEKRTSPDYQGDLLLQIKDLRFAYSAGALVLDGINLQLRPGEILAVMGANGSGKSTLLRCMMGLLQPMSGDVLLNGRSILGQDTAELARKIAYLPQYPDDLLFAETVYQELEITLNNQNIQSQERIEATLQNLSLAEFAENYPRDLSTGQRQRTALGAVTVAQPDLIFVDEPTRGQDSRIKNQLREIWQRWRDEGIGLIIVSHDVELVVQLADRVMIMSEGKIEASGPVQDVLADSELFAPQIARLFPGSGWITLEDALTGLAKLQGIPVRE